MKSIDLEIIFEGAGFYKLYYLFLYHTGLRANDVACLKYGHIDFDKKSIARLIRKSRRIHEFPLADVLINALDRDRDADAPIFPTLYDEREQNDKLAKPRKYMQTLLKANGRPHATLHSFRHTFNTKLRDLGMSIEDRRVLLSHATSSVTKIYTHPNLEVAKELINKL